MAEWWYVVENMKERDGYGDWSWPLKNGRDIVTGERGIRVNSEESRKTEEIRKNKK